MRSQDEEVRLRHENVFVDGYTAHRLRIFKEFLATDLGKKDLRLICLELARQKEEAKKQARQASLTSTTSTTNNSLDQTSHPTNDASLDISSSINNNNNAAGAAARRHSNASQNGNTGWVETRRRSSVVANGVEQQRRRSSVGLEGLSIAAAGKSSSVSDSGQSSMEGEAINTVDAGIQQQGDTIVRRKSSVCEGVMKNEGSTAPTTTASSGEQAQESESDATPQVASDTIKQSGVLSWFPDLTLTIKKGLGLKRTTSGREDPLEMQEAVDLDQAEARKIFGMFDGDGSGSIDVVELKALLEQMCIPLRDDEVGKLMEEMDTDKSNSIDFEEFYAWYQTEAKRQKKDRFVKSMGLHVNKLLR